MAKTSCIYSISSSCMNDSYSFNNTLTSNKSQRSSMYAGLTELKDLK
jgi:hypothetical protein